MATTTKKNTLNDLTRFAASTVPATAPNKDLREGAAKTFIAVVEAMSGAILKANGVKVPSNLESPSMEVAVGDMFWALAAIAVAYNLDLEQIASDTLPEYQRRNVMVQAMRQDPVEFILKQFGIDINLD